MKELKQRIKDITGPPALHHSMEEIVKRLNPVLRGWMNYFKYGNSTRKFSQIDSYVYERLVLFWSKKHRKSGRRWREDLSWKRYKETGIQILGGNVVYWSALSNAR
jgi:hypothetical protein